MRLDIKENHLKKLFTIGKTKEHAVAFMIHNDKKEVTTMTPSINLDTYNFDLIDF